MFLGKYTKDSVTDKTFSAITYGTTYLAYNTTDKTYTLLATIVADEIEGISEEAASYENDGRLVLYAPESSSVELVDGKNYNSYVFMDNETLTNSEAVIDKNKEYDKVTNKGTEEGYLYGFNPSTELYDKINKNSVLNTVKATTLTDVLVSKDLIGYGEELVKVGADVTIWGLSDKDDNGVYSQFTLAELADMYDLVDEYNKAQMEELGEDYVAEDALTIDMIMLYYKDSNDEYVLSSIIVEIFEADEDEVVYSVNDTIFVNYNK